MAQGLCYNYEQTKNEMIHTHESLRSKEIDKSQFVAVPLDEYEKFVNWKNETDN